MDTRVVIQDDDPQPTITINDAHATEGSDITFGLSISGAHAVPVSVHYATANGTAVQPSDYDSTSGNLAWAPGDVSTQNVTVPTHDDSSFSLGETFTVNLSSPINGSFGDNSGLGTIDESGSQLPPSLAIDSPTVWEGNSGTSTMTFTVTKTGATEVPASVDWTTQDGNSPIATSGASCPGVDYVAGSGTLTIPPGNSSGTIDVTICGDTALENDEFLRVHLSNPINASIGTADGDGEIKDDDAASLVLSGGPPSDNTGPVAVQALVKNTDGEEIPGVLVRFEQYRHGSTAGLTGTDFNAIDLAGSGLAGYDLTGDDFDVDAAVVVETDGQATLTVSGPTFDADDVIVACTVTSISSTIGVCAQATDGGTDFTIDGDTTLGTPVSPGDALLLAWFTFT